MNLKDPRLCIFISEIPGEDDYDVRRTIFISSALLMGVMKLSVMSDLGQIQPISHHPDHLGPANVLFVVPRDAGTRGLLHN